MSDAQIFADLLKAHFFSIRELSDLQVEKLYRHYTLLTRWNKVLNLTTIRDVEEVVLRHYCESLFLGVQLPVEPVRVLDVGSGSGFPGIPMAILRADCGVVLAESHQRRAVFLKEASRNRPNIQVRAERAEHIGEHFDWIVSRAVAWNEILPIARRAGGSVALLLGEQDAGNAARTSGFLWLPAVPMPWGKRRVALIGNLCST